MFIFSGERNIEYLFLLICNGNYLETIGFTTYILFYLFVDEKKSQTIGIALSQINIKDVSYEH